MATASQCLESVCEDHVEFFETWSKIYAELRVDNKLYGTDLQKMLHQLGWKTLYWNPDPTQNAKWDLEDQTLSPLQPGFKKT